MSESGAPHRGWRAALGVYAHPRVATMTLLGFSAGLPLLLVGGTFSAWLSDLGVARTAIGFLSWVGLAHSLKIFWAPLVDRLSIPLLTRWLGKRRAWMLAAQLTIAGALLGISLTDPTEALGWVAAWAVLAAFASASQDVAVDAYRIEAVGDDLQGAMAATYVFGYRVALLAAGAGALHLADIGSWSGAYAGMAVLTLVGIVTTLAVREPKVARDSGTEETESRVLAFLETTRSRGAWRDLQAWFIGAVVCPFAEFFTRWRWQAVLLLLLIGTFRISDIFMGVMANPFYLELGFSKSEIANVAAAFGLAVTLAGAAVGGLLVARFGIPRMLVATALLAPITNLVFVWLAGLGAEIYGLVAAIVADNLSGGMAIAVFIAFLSSLTRAGYTATQYALFSSLMTLPGQFAGGFSGWLVDIIGYAGMFLTSAALGIPAILLALWYWRVTLTAKATDEGAL
ncbi:AmpG family muropeptide MFS transporter [Algiphilus aromaticivorans]|uniref:AmpG family muropeptide MFS transporter n=1 Tax=Algiphilus aromaticivorans TaxID=382454 RepID=UPI000A7EE141|nr:MFS transporter [Algiphilus aromaticivorans]